jgi:hypothetical protein
VFEDVGCRRVQQALLLACVDAGGLPVARTYLRHQSLALYLAVCLLHTRPEEVRPRQSH